MKSSWHSELLLLLDPKENNWRCSRELLSLLEPQAGTKRTEYLEAALRRLVHPGE